MVISGQFIQFLVISFYSDQVTAYIVGISYYFDNKVKVLLQCKININCQIINFIYAFFTYKPESFYVQLLNYTIYYYDLTQFGRSKFGQINILFVYITRDVVILLIVIGLNIFIVILLNNYSKNKKEMDIQSEKLMLINKKNKKITIMVIAMIISSSLEHLIFIITYFYYIISQDQYASAICNFVSLIAIILKQISLLI